MTESRYSTLLINDWQTKAAFTAVEKNFQGFVFTESPYVYEKLIAEKKNVISLSDLVATDILRDAGDRVFRLAKQWQDEMDRELSEDFDGIRCGFSLGRPMAHFVSAFVYRALQIAAVLQRSDSVCVPYLAKDKSNLLQESPQRLNPLQCNYFAILAQSRAIDGLVPLALDDSIQKVSQGDAPSEIKLGFRDAASLRALRWFGQKNHVLAKLILRAMRLFRRHAQKKIILFQPSDFVQALLPAFACKNFGVCDYQIPKIQPFSKTLEIGSLQDTLVELSREIFSKHPLVLTALRIAAMRLCSYLQNRFFPLWKTIDADVVKRMVDWNPQKSWVLGNGLYDGEDILFQKACARHGLPFVAFEHGGIGLTVVDNEMAYFADKNHCSAYIAHNSYEMKFYEGLQPRAVPHWTVRGVERDHAAVSRSLCRFIGRRFLKSDARKPQVLYVPTRFREDNIWINNDFRDVSYWEFIKQLIFGTFAHCNADIFIKLHQKGWLPNQKALYRLRRHPIELISLPGNTRFSTFPQLNYIRWAADILIVDRATSTIQWALATDRPLIYLDHPANPLHSDVRDRMCESVFVVNVADTDWKNQITHLVNLSFVEREKIWQEKAQARQKFFEHFVFGKSKTESEIAEWIIKTAQVNPLMNFKPLSGDAKKISSGKSA